MTLAIILITIVSIISLVATLMVAGKSDEGYQKATKRNITSLTLIYGVTILGSIVALCIIIFF